MESFNELKGIKPLFDLFYDPDNIDIENFPIIELKNINKGSFSFFNKFPKGKIQLKQALEKYFLEHPNEEELIQIYFTHFVSS